MKYRIVDKGRYRGFEVQSQESLFGLKWWSALRVAGDYGKSRPMRASTLESARELLNKRLIERACDEQIRKERAERVHDRPAKQHAVVFECDTNKPLEEGKEG